jgi:hypothetical protein
MQLKVIMREEQIFVTGFCRQYMMVFLNQNLHIFLRKLGSISVGISMLRTTGTGGVLIPDRLLKYPYRIRGLMCGMPLVLYECSAHILLTDH